jgi:hypothetical protein
LLHRKCGTARGGNFVKALLFRGFIFIVSCLLLTSGLAVAQSEQTTAENPPLEQPLVREGDFAVKLVEALNLGMPESETEAESILASLDITPRNGWIADYPVTPDIADELQTAVSEAAESGKIALSKEAALTVVQNVLEEYDLSVRSGASEEGASEASGASYPDSEAEDTYYYDEGPPVVTYYAPPPDYAYLYTWVPYPFWWSDIWFPGFFVLADFDVDVDRHRHRHGGDHDHLHRHDHGKFVSNHFVNPETGGVSRIDPAHRYRGGTFSGGAGRPAPSTRQRVHTIPNTSRGHTAAGRYREFRGYDTSGPPSGNRSSAFDSSRNSQFERNASDRGFQSRSAAGRISGSRPGGSRGVRGGVGGFHGGSGPGFHGGGEVRH